MNLELQILRLSDNGVQCTASSDTGDSFWLPRSQHVGWSAPPEPGELVTASVPQWLAAKHRQLVGDVAFESEKAKHDTRKERMMTDRPVDAGKGALFKNTKREKPSHPDYRGECEIKGRKFWVSGWIRKSEKTGETYMSLAFREAEEQRTVQQAPARDWQRSPADADIPF